MVMINGLGIGTGMRAFCVVFVALLSLVGCTGINTKVSAIPNYLSVGDTVLLTTRDSSEYEFEVVEITDSAIIGESITVPLQDISIARIKDGDVIYETTGRKIGGFIVGVLTIIALVPM